jgi:hypothetical protein
VRGGVWNIVSDLKNILRKLKSRDPGGQNYSTFSSEVEAKYIISVIESYSYLF